MSKKQFTITISIVVVILAAVGGVVWYAQSQQQNQNQPVTENSGQGSQDSSNTANNQLQGEVVGSSAADVDTSNWLTYRNKEYGFEVKYPRELKVNESKKGSWVAINLATSDQVNSLFNISNGPAGFETAKLLDKVIIGSESYERYENNRVDYMQYIITGLPDNFYITYNVTDHESKDTSEMILESFSFIK